jgi:hypothetical protein
MISSSDKTMITDATTFIRLFDTRVVDSERHIDGIEIPMLQRDYAQGRRSDKVDRVRRNFLKALHCALTPEGRPIQLDFIYGIVEKPGSGQRILTPLDGQQRLTTLFLLHWYVAKREGVDVADYAFLDKFTYRTRFSSRDFCRELVKYCPNFGENVISADIVDQPWFMLQWEHDPTIASMLVMLDAIHAQFRDLHGLWARLVDTTNPAISFYFLPINEIGQTDSLYITMNSRGKSLTDFEHFKAEFEKILHGVDEALRKKFIDKIDTDWTDMFWRQRTDGSALIDSQFMRYFRFVTEVLCFEQDIPTESNDIDLARNVYGNEQKRGCDNVHFLFDAIDCWATANSIEQIFSGHLSPERHEAGKVKMEYGDTNLFRQCCLSYGIMNNNTRVFTLNKALLLYAFLVYRLNQGNGTITKEEFSERIRIVRNLVANSSFEIREQNMGQLLRETETIVKQGMIDTESVSFSKTQKEEEYNKMQWRRAWPAYIAKLNELEDHDLLDGAIAVIGLANGPDFEKKATAFMRLFDGSVSYDKIKQAMLCLGDYSQKISWRFIFGGEADSTWRDLFTVSSQREYFNNTFKVLAELLCKLGDDTSVTLNDITEIYLNNPDTPKDWRYYFVKYQEMRKGRSGAFYWRNDKQNPYDVLMMNTPAALSGRHWNPFHYTASCRFSDIFSLEEYGNPLLVRATGHRVFSTNDAWVVKHPSDEVELLRIPVKTNGLGVDQIDRIEILSEQTQEIVKACMS